MEPVPLRHRWEVCNNTRCCSLIVARWNITGLHKEAVRPLFSQTQVSLSSYELSYDSLSPFPYNCICSPSLSLAWFPCLAPSAEENLSFLWKQWCRHRPSSWTAPYVSCLSIAATTAPSFLFIPSPPLSPCPSLPSFLPSSLLPSSFPISSRPAASWRSLFEARLFKNFNSQSRLCFSHFCF